MKILLLFLMLITLDAHAKDKYRFCNIGQASEIQMAVDSATTMLHFVQTYPNDDLFKRWFGNTSPNTIKELATKLEKPLADATFECRCDANIFAFVIKDDFYKIHLCSKFWLANNIGYNSKSSTIVHELSHFDNTLNTTDFTEHYQEATNLAIYFPESAIRNAVNWEYLLVEIYRKNQ